MGKDDWLRDGDEWCIVGEEDADIARGQFVYYPLDWICYKSCSKAKEAMMGKIAGKPKTIQQVVASYMNCSLASREILSLKCANEILELVTGCEPGQIIEIYALAMPDHLDGDREKKIYKEGFQNGHNVGISKYTQNITKLGE